MKDQSLVMIGRTTSKHVYSSILYKKKTNKIEFIQNNNSLQILSPKWVTNQSYQWDSNLILLDTVGEKLSSEILSEGGSWGIMVINKMLII